MATEPRRLHLGVVLGLSAGAYALSLAAVTAQQAAADAAVVADRAPTADAIARLGSGHDSLESEARRARLAYERATGAYDEMTNALADVEGRLGQLTGIVGAVDGAARALPARVALPRIVRSVGGVAPATVHATTGGSGH